MQVGPRVFVIEQNADGRGLVVEILTGRALDAKQKLMSEAAGKIQAIAGIAVEDVWFYIQEIDAPQMIEFGRFLPEPGAEDTWRKAITPGKRAELERAGIKV